MDNPASIAALFVGQPKTITDAQGTWTSSIMRDPIHNAVMARPGGLEGDRVAQPYHGGADADLCVHLMDHYRFWNKYYEMALTAGHVGENLTLDGVVKDEVCAGDILRCGEALVQVSAPRVPCKNLARRIGRPDWIRLTILENRTGFYLRVLEPGLVRPGDRWELLERLNPEGSIPAINRCLYLEYDPEFTARLQNMRGLSHWIQTQALERLEQREAHWTTRMKEGGD